MSLVAARQARETPDAVALADERRSITWAELDENLNRAANALLAIDLGTARRVAVFAENSAETVMAHMAGILVGVSTVPINSHLTPAEVSYILKDSQASALFVGPETAPAGLNAAAEANVPRVIGWRCPSGVPVTPWDEWLRKSHAGHPPSDMPPRPFLHYTSGTTGRPKGTETPPGMFFGGATVAEYFEKLKAGPTANSPGATVAERFEKLKGGPTAGSSKPVLVVSPLYHAGPLSSLRQFGAGTPLVVLDRFDAERTLWAIDRYKVGSTVMVPTHFQRLLALPEETRARYDTSSLWMVAHTGSACPVEVKRKMIEWLGPILFEAYGATEAPGTNVITSQEWLEHPGSDGKTVFPFELLVIGENGEHLGPDQVGQLYFRDTTGRGIIYHNDPDKTQAAHQQPGIFTLGDMGYADKDGYVYVTDRSSDMVVSGGVNIYPAETEQVLITHPEVADVAVIGVPNTEMGEELKALIVLADPASPPDTEELDALCREHLAGYKCPRSYDFVADIRRTTMGKVNKRKLRAPYWPTERTIGG